MGTKRICSICEAGCGLIIDADGRKVVSIEANPDDVFSQGHVCAKGIALKDLDADPDRLRQPLLRRDGELQPVGWDEAFEFIAEKLRLFRDRSDPNAVAVYFGNPTAHNIGLSMGAGVFAGMLGSTNIYSAGSVDQLPKQLASALMFGSGMAVPVPDITRTDFLLMLGANPIVSNGSLWMVPGFRQKLRDLQRRGGRLVTIDPRRTETARLADAHHFIRPGTDAFLLAALINEIVQAGREPDVSVGVRHWQELKKALAPVSLALASERCGLSEEALRALTRQMLNAESPVVYGRVGTTLQQHGTLTSFLVEVLNMLLGALDRPGGAMFPEQPFTSARSGGELVSYNRWQSRVSGYPEVLGQMPCAALAEEIETPGEGQIRALFCFAGNPVVSNPDSDRLAKALGSLELLVCCDIYHNETTRLADVVLPGSSPFEDSHYDSFLGAMGWRNSARYSPPIFEAEAMREWDMAMTLSCLAASGRVPSDEERRDFEDNIVANAATGYVADVSSPLHGRDIQEIIGSIGPESGVERLLDLGIRAGRWGDHFDGADGLTLQRMIETPDGIDLGELRGGRLAEVVTHADGCIELAPAVIIDALTSLVATRDNPGLRLVGRRQAATNNSWLGNLPSLTKGTQYCQLQMHPEDAAEHGVAELGRVRLVSAAGSIEAEVTLTDDLMKGCVCLPHGFSEQDDLSQGVRRPGPNYNRLAAAAEVDRPSGTSALNGIAVTVERL